MNPMREINKYLNVFLAPLEIAENGPQTADPFMHIFVFQKKDPTNE